MHTNIFFISHFIIFCNRYYLVNTKPLIGPNVRNARTTEFPYAVSLIKMANIRDIERMHVCTGVLITRRDVAIAEHCVMYDDIETLQVIVGSVNVRSGMKYFLFWWITYEQWAVRKRMSLEFDVNDVANIRLRESVIYTIKPAKFTNRPVPVLYGKTVTAIGWGWVNATVLNKNLQVGNLKVLTNDDCMEKISALAGEELPVDPNHVICTAAEPYVLLTYGDSGGPLMYNDEFIGIHKGACPNNLDETNPQLINLDMSVLYYKRFFMEVINEEEN